MKLTKAERELVRRATELFAQYMKEVASANGFKTVNEYFELDRIDDMFCGGDYQGNPKANDALNLLNEAAWASVKAWAEEHPNTEKQYEHRDCDQFGCDRGGCPRRRIYNAIYRRLLARFQIPEFVIIWPPELR